MNAAAGGKGLRILASVSPGEVRVVLLSGDELREAWVERPARPDGVGDVHRARVSALAPAMAGAFLALEGGETGFLPDGEMPGKRGGLSEGQGVLVRVSRAAQGGKGPRLTARLSAAEAALGPAEGPPKLLAQGPEAALRLARALPTAPVVTDGPALAARLRAALGEGRVVLSHQPVFDAALDGEFAALAEPEVPLPGGGRLLIHPTPALTAIDVDAGPVAGQDRAAQQRFNLLAVAESARQVRLRRLAGGILLDLAGLSVKQRAAYAEPLGKALARDGLAQLLGLGPLGLFEIRRQRVHPPLHEVLAGPLTPGLAALRQAVREDAAVPGRRLALRVAPVVLAALQGLPGALAEAEAAMTRKLTLRPDPSLPLAGWTIEEMPHGG
ncbi:ribonuclease E/G [Siccirubricoccus sp. KC 17139]|uniref:Ribonuclease E/G n=1 Tax=Siccirubricoccus soli TaxID=2899147 RepID=A0ABT1CZL4_9PROT|nr:ribonuclease E/G [Siccirubricoccus soli]MCO6414857.1 ribonuclease E/G [Siccirubricoccus soli]MCP2680987.1 ribonuclease E/G [Siccirubricoccus soli]